MLDMMPLQALVRSLGSTTCEATAMPGGASTRQYFRIELDGSRSAVAMFVPDGPKPEEIDKAGIGSRWPFLEVRDLLEARGIHVPRVLGEDTERGWLLLEDLGDDTLANYLLTHPQQKTALYTQAVTDLARAQVALAELPAGCVIERRAFDEDLLRWEVEHFREWAVEGRGFAFTSEDAADFARISERLAQRVAAMPRGFVHRDYQSRNIMVRLADTGPELVWIDFQDALLGPRTYDLVALLGDSYQEFDTAFVQERQTEFANAHGYDDNETAAIRREFDWVTLQRKLKDAGRFVFIDKVKGNPSFLQFVVPTIHKVMVALERLQDDEDARLLTRILTTTLPDDTKRA